MPTSHLNLPPRIFVSHSHKDNDFGMRLIAGLRAALGEDAVWYDVSGGLHGGDAWWRKIVAELSARSVFIVILSPDAMASPWVNDEIDLAWKQKNSPEGKVIVPVLYRTCQVREDLQTRQLVSFLPPKPYETALAELFAALGLPAPAPQSAPALAPKPVVAPVPPTGLVFVPAVPGASAHVEPVPAPALAADTAPALAVATPSAPESEHMHTEAVAQATGEKSAAITRTAVSRRSFLRTGGIATGVGLAALAGTGLLAYARLHGALGAGAHSTATTRPTTPSPTPPMTVKPTWTKKLSGEIIGSPLFASGQLYVGGGDEYLYAFSPGGQQTWKTSLHSRITTTPVMAAPGILCVTAGGYLYGIDAGSGAAHWSVTYPLLSADYDAQPIVASGLVYLLDSFGMSKFDPRSGKMLPTDDYSVPNGTSVPPIDDNGFMPAFDGAHIYAITYPGHNTQVQQFKLSGGNPVWTHDIGSELTAPVVANSLSMLYVGAADEYLYALRTSDGSQAWRFLTANLMSQAPAFDSGTVYVASGITLYALDAASGGTPRWNTAIGTSMHSQPVIANGVVYLGADNYVYTFDATSGTILRRFQASDIASGTVSSTPVVAGSTLYAATGGGMVAAFAL